MHALPSVRVLGKMQTPVLIYNSQQAVLHPLVTLDVAIPAGTTVPDIISHRPRARLRPAELSRHNNCHHAPLLVARLGYIIQER